MKANSLTQNPVHLGLGATALVEPEFSGLPWYEAYAKRHEGDGAEGRLVSMYTFSESWDVWERHPHGSEVVICVSGQLSLIQEQGDKATSLVLETGEYAINPPGVWHTADVTELTTAIFITAGWGTEHRPR